MNTTTYYIHFLSKFGLLILLIGLFCSNMSAQTEIDYQQLDRDSLMDELLDQQKRKIVLQENQIVLNREFGKIEAAYNETISNNTAFYFTFPINSANDKQNHHQLVQQTLAAIDSMVVEQLYHLLTTLDHTSLSDQIDLKFRVMGFASPDGTDEYNLTLSQKRAETITQLFEQHSLEQENISIQYVPYGRGENVLYEMKQLGKKHKRSVLVILESIDLIPAPSISLN